MTKGEIKSLFSIRRNTKALLANEHPHHIRLIDSLRALSFHWVFGFHVIYMLRLFIPQERIDAYFESTSILAFLWRGPLGVDVFFVISGFLITLLMILEYQKKGKIDIVRFYKRRFMRLMPVYYTAMIIIIVGYLPRFEKVQLDTTANAWANFLYVNNFLPFSDQFMLWSWSLAVEEQFYILFPLLFILLMKSGARVFKFLMVILVLSIAIRWVLFDPNLLNGSVAEIYLLDSSAHLFSAIYDKLYTRFGAILCGVIAAFIYVYKSDQVTKWIQKFGSKTRILEVGLIASLFYIAIIIFEVDTNFGHVFIIIHRTLFSAILAVLILIYLFSDKSVVFLKSFLEAKFWYPLGQLSYSNYIWHPMALFVCYFIFWDPEEVITFAEVVMTIVFGYLATMILSYLSYVYIEKPSMDMRMFMR